MNIVGISGSLREDSTNTKLLTAAAKIAPTTCNLNLTKLVGELPLFSPDIVANSVASVEAWTNLIRASDGIIISTPEYAHGYPGALKNAFDWLVQGDGFVKKPFMFLGASSRAELSQTTLTTVLETMSGIHMKKADVVIPLLGKNMTVDEIISEPNFRASLDASLKTYAIAIEALA